MDIVAGDLLTSGEALIAQQCCCTAVKPHGLSAAIARTLGADPYSKRKRIGRRNHATADSRPEPGTIEVIESRTGGQVACLFAQYAMGPPGKYDNDGRPDTETDRVTYFRQALAALGQWMQRHQYSRIAFPYGIGCGLARGKWGTYQALIEKFSRDWDVQAVLYRLPS